MLIILAIVLVEILAKLNAFRCCDRCEIAGRQFSIAAAEFRRERKSGKAVQKGNIIINMRRRERGNTKHIK